MDKNTKMTVAISMAVLAVFLGALAFRGGNKADQTESAATVATSTDATTTLSAVRGAGATGLPKQSEIPQNKTTGLSVVDQLADDTVAFSGVTIDEDTWVAVYDERNGEPAWMMGAGLIFKGTTEGVSPVLRNTVAGSRYYVTLIKDNGDRVFNLSEDRPVAGAPVVSFVAK